MKPVQFLVVSGILKRKWKPQAELSEMDLLLISLLLFSTFSHVHPSTINEPKLWQSNTIQANSVGDALKPCTCWPDGLPPTFQQLDSQNNGLERLVIYLYKNDATNEIKMYTPNANKQMLIPEIPYEASDGLVTVTTENVYTLFYNNPNKIKVFNDHIEKLVPPVTESFAIGLNTGAIENFYPNGDNYLNPNINYKGNEYPLAKNIIITNGPNGDVINEPEKGSTNIPYNVFPAAYNPNTNLTPDQTWIPNNYPYTIPDDPQAVPFNPQTTADNAQTIPEDPLVISVNPQSPLYTLQVTPFNSQSVLPNAPALPYNSQDYSINPQEIPGNSQAVPGSHIGELDQDVVYTFQNDQGSNKLQPGSQDINNPLSAQYMTFNNWFHQQIKRFQNVHLPNDIKTIDSNALKILVQKTFYENNIYISANGEITDSKGIVIDASNLELRPLLLGETFNHQILQNAKVIKLPKNLPYLEGILVTLVSPPQILGIIPLGKTYLAETSYQIPSLGGITSVNGSKIYINGIGNPNAASYSTSDKGPYTLAYKDIYAGPTQYYVYSEANGIPIAINSDFESKKQDLPVAYPIGNKKSHESERNYWGSGPYHTVSELPYPTANWNPSELMELLKHRRKLPDAVIQHHYDQPLRTRKKGNGPKKPTDLKENVTTVEPFLNTNATESGRRFPGPSISGIMKTLLYLLDDLPSRRGLNSTEEVDIESESESKNDGGTPDFRIIGGNAATGSGTPLSNKGRSGVEYA